MLKDAGGKHKLTITPTSFEQTLIAGDNGPFKGGYFLCTNNLRSKCLKDCIKLTNKEDKHCRVKI